MAQTGYTPIQIYSSSTGGALPSAGNLTNSTLGSELAINITDGKLFYKDNANAIQVIGWKTTPTTAGGTGLTSYTAGDLLYYATGTTLAKLGIGASTTVLTSSGTAPQWTAQSALSVGEALNLKSNATTGVMQIVGPAASTTRVMTIPNANFTAARTDAAQTFTGTQTFAQINTTAGYQFRAADDTSYELLRYVGGTNNPGIFTKATESTKNVAIFASGSSIAGQILKLGVEAVEDVLSLAYSGASAGVTFKYNNLIQGTAAKGINFTANTPAAGMTSQLLNWYEEGTWTPTVTSGSGTITTYASGGTYTRVGRQVTVTAYVDLTNVGTAGGLLVISNFPYKNGAASNAGYLQQSGVVRETGVTGVNYACFITGNSTTGYIQSLTGGAISWTNTYQYALSITYYTA